MIKYIKDNKIYIGSIAVIIALSIYLWITYGMTLKVIPILISMVPIGLSMSNSNKILKVQSLDEIKKIKKELEELQSLKELKELKELKRIKETFDAANSKLIDIQVNDRKPIISISNVKLDVAKFGIINPNCNYLERKHFIEEFKDSKTIIKVPVKITIKNQINYATKVQELTLYNDIDGSILKRENNIRLAPFENINIDFEYSFEAEPRRNHEEPYEISKEISFKNICTFSDGEEIVNIAKCILTTRRAFYNDRFQPNFYTVSYTHFAKIDFIENIRYYNLEIKDA